MIKLKSLLLEHPNEYSWLSPNGTFYPTHDHVRTAKQILTTLNAHKDAIEYSPYESLWERRYQRITNMYNADGTEIYTHNPYYPPNPIQERVLINMAIENGCSGVFYEKAGQKFITLWDKNSQLE